MGVDLVAGRSAREGVAFDDIEAWMERRKAQVGQFVREAEVAGRKAWNDATRSGQNVLARTQSELAALGSRHLPSGLNGSASPRPGSQPATKSRLDQNAAAKVMGGGVAQIAGNVVGLGQGAWDSAKGLGQGALFATRLLDPYDTERDNSAWVQMFDAGKGVVDYAKKGIANPASVAADFKNLGHQLYVDTVPSATPMADTFAGEVNRSYNLGLNQGKLDWDLGSLLFGGAASKALRGLGSASEGAGAAKFASQGFSAAQADYLAAPYEGMGHHALSRAAARDIGLPQALTDSIFNVLKPNKISRGDFYELHYRVDPSFHGTGFPVSVGRPGWSGKKLGLQKDGPLTGLWNGTPAALNTVVGIGGVAGLSQYPEREDLP